jgi:HNH endonuclease
MHYWWVNQKQTYRHEVPGGYMWSPKKNVNGDHLRPYDLMRSIQPGDIVFSFANGLIKAIGIASSYCYGCPKPTEFGNAGSNWGDVGWRVDVSFKELTHPIRPKSHILELLPFLPKKYSPIQNNGDGNQAYLFDITQELALGLAHLMDRWVVDLIRGNMVLDLPNTESSSDNIKKWEDSIEESINSNQAIPETVRETLVKSRVGQGQFRKDLLLIESICRVTKVDNPVHLIASHTKPWRDSSNEERLDPENGFMLTPTIDHLFDRGFISFENNGKLIVSDVAHIESIERMGLLHRKDINVGNFTVGQQNYLDWHRDSILL